MAAAVKHPAISVVGNAPNSAGVEEPWVRRLCPPGREHAARGKRARADTWHVVSLQAPGDEGPWARLRCRAGAGACAARASCAAARVRRESFLDARGNDGGHCTHGLPSAGSHRGLLFVCTGQLQAASILTSGAARSLARRRVPPIVERPGLQRRYLFRGRETRNQAVASLCLGSRLGVAEDRCVTGWWRR